MQHTQAPDAAVEMFTELLAPVLGPAYGTALSWTGNAADAEDIVQDAVLNAWRGFDSFEPGTKFKAWFFHILTNCHYGRLRHLQRRIRTVDLDKVPDLFLYNKTAEVGLHATTEDPAQVLMDHLCEEEVRQALDALPDKYREVAALYFMEDFSYEEIAEILDVPIGTVRSRLHRGRRMLQKLLWRVAQEAGVVERLGAAGSQTH
jgi:RNA polymerase sigma-70 factor (ECF subfamily)